MSLTSQVFKNRQGILLSLSVLMFMPIYLQMAEADNSPSVEQLAEGQDGMSDHQALRDAMESMFQNRFTESDEVFMKNMAVPLDPPPTVENWYTRPKRTFDWTRFVSIKITICL